MQLPHLALTVIEDPDNDGSYHWLLLQAGDDEQLHEHSASEQSFPTLHDAFQDGTIHWAANVIQEDEDADPVGSLDGL